MLEELTRRLEQHEDLTADQVQVAVAHLVNESVSAETKAVFLTALAQKGETPEEISVFAQVLRKMATTVPVDEETRANGILDVVGTGGDRAGTFNLSTGAAIVCASAGVTVAKHGNRAVTSKTGSADVLEALGVPIVLDPLEAAASLKHKGFAFLFAPRYHPAFKQIAPARRLCAERGQRTLFNYLGPLLNPSFPTAQLMGVSQPDLCEPMAHVLKSLGVRRGMVVCGNVGPAGEGPAWLDELSTLGPTVIAEFHEGGKVNVSQLARDLFRFGPATIADLRGGTREENASILVRLLTGQEKGPKLDALLLNAGAGLFVSGKVRSIIEGCEYAAKLIEQGIAGQKLESIRSPH
ncbi:MAG: anthranilate phosphoribosyltransferase [Verrucomicrobiae bacterium]|nr:anthranilate phosphoribosyltransferase [Verrucomicrobiae bacterium]